MTYKLFKIEGFVLNGNVDTTVHTLMRQIIAMEVASDHETYNEGMLGRPNAEYCSWIQQPSSWGGAIEVSGTKILHYYYFGPLRNETMKQFFSDLELFLNKLTFGAFYRFYGHCKKS